MPSYAPTYTSSAFLRRKIPRSPLASGDCCKHRLADGKRWRFSHQSAPHVSITGYEDGAFTEYIISTAFGNGPAVVARHRFSDFLKLHESIVEEEGDRLFPVGKVLPGLHTAEVKASRARKLGQYLSEAVARSVEAWSHRVKSGIADADSDVLTPALQAFLGAREIDQARLDSLRRSGSLSSDSLIDLLLRGGGEAGSEPAA